MSCNAAGFLKKTKLMKFALNLLAVPLCVFLFASCSVFESGSNKTVKLFNGENLDGWYTYIKGRGKNSDPKKVFTVSDGMVRISGEEFGCITTENEYENYKISLEYKWGDKTYGNREFKARDSGLLIHSVGEDGSFGGVWMESIECNIVEGGTGDFWVVCQRPDRYFITVPCAEKRHPDGRLIFENGGAEQTISIKSVSRLMRDPNWMDVKGFRGANDDVENPVGEWNKVECIAKGGHIEVYVNGRLVNIASNSSLTKGKIQLQSEGAEIFYRNIYLTKLD